MPSKRNRPAALQRRSTSGSNTKLTLSGLNQKLDTSSNLQLQVALNNATKDLPKGKGKKTSPLRSNQPPSRTASDQQIRTSSKPHLQQTQRTTSTATRSTSSQYTDAPHGTRSSKRSGFTLDSPVVVSHEIEGEGDDSDEWVSSESLAVTPQNQSSDSGSGDEDDDVVRNLPANLNLTGAAHIATSSADREPPTPTVPQVQMQPPTPVKERQHNRSSTVLGPNEVVSTADDHGNQDHYAARPEEVVLASTPRSRAVVDRDTEPSRHLPPPPGPDPTTHNTSAANLRALRDRPQQSTLSTHSNSESHPHITSPSSDSNPQGRDQIAMTQQQHQPQARPQTPTRPKRFPLSSPPSPTHQRREAKGDFSQSATKRSGARPPSLHSLPQGKSDHPTMMTRPHPLIRGPSGAPSSPNVTSAGNTRSFTHQNGVSTVAFGSGIGKLAPLTTITAAPSVSSSPTSSSPISARLKGKEEDEVKERLRRQSIASVSSVNTQRSLGRAAGYEYANQGSGLRNPRERTLSTISSSSYAALSALYPHHGTSSPYPPKSPGGLSHQPGPAYGFTSCFPSAKGVNVRGPTASDLMHMLLPAPYLSAHMTVLKGRSPIREAVERVTRARKAQSSQ